MGKVKEREREGHSVSHRAGHRSHYGEGSRHCKPLTCKERGLLKSGFGLGNRKQKAKLWKPRWKSVLAHLVRISGGSLSFFFFLSRAERLLGSCTPSTCSNRADFGKHTISSSPPAMSLLSYPSSSERVPGGMLQRMPRRQESK